MINFERHFHWPENKLWLFKITMLFKFEMRKILEYLWKYEHSQCYIWTYLYTLHCARSWVLLSCFWMSWQSWFRWSCSCGRHHVCGTCPCTPGSDCGRWSYLNHRTLPRHTRTQCTHSKECWCFGPRDIGGSWDSGGSGRRLCLEEERRGVEIHFKILSNSFWFI